MNDGALPLSQSELIAAIEAGKQFKWLVFYGHTAKADGVGRWMLSQWWPVEFTVDGVLYRSAEHWMMAGKARLFDDQPTLDAILAAKTPGEAKALGRQVTPFEVEWWSRASFHLVVAGNVHKFGQHPALREYLLGTGDRILVEAAPRDRIWGVGMGASNPAIEDPSKWRGHNLLGFALMEARNQLR